MRGVVILLVYVATNPNFKTLILIYWFMLYIKAFGILLCQKKYLIIKSIRENKGYSYFNQNRKFQYIFPIKVFPAKFLTWYFTEVCFMNNRFLWYMICGCFKLFHFWWSYTKLGRSQSQQLNNFLSNFLICLNKIQCHNKLLRNYVIWTR